MITPDFARTMARYNRWQNASLYTAAGTLDEVARRQDRGAFFGSIHRTHSHVLWGDSVWMSRFRGWDRPETGIPGSPDWVGNWETLVSRRRQADLRILEWSEGLAAADLEGHLSWYSGVLSRDVTRPMALCVVHFFNHQTHHRGQIHAMLTAADARPADTDLFALPETA